MGTTGLEDLVSSFGCKESIRQVGSSVWLVNLFTTSFCHCMFVVKGFVKLEGTFYGKDSAGGETLHNQ